MVLLTPTRPGLLRYATSFDRSVAGAESNLAIGLARLGHRVGWMSRVGDDEFGQCVLSFVRGEGVDVSRVIVDPAAPTAVFFKERRAAGITRVYYYRAGSAASRLSPEDLDPAYIRQARYLHLSGITPALSASCRAAVLRAMDIAREAAIPIAFDPNIRLKLWPAARAREVLRALIGRTNLVLASQEEAELLTGELDPERAARALLELGPALAIVKLGANGALAVGDGGVVHEPVLEVEVVDTIGAGDAFAAGFLAAQLRGWELPAALRLANIMGALTTTVPGDVEGMPTWTEVQPYLGGTSLVTR
ncbi:MAG: sugar kinase [Ardenticatenaceae bacterium]|nr:sugar kinase [Ardenticatenaceae bacterium]